MNETMEKTLSKVPEITLIFWIIKICATTLGETAGDAMSMTMHLGYAVSSGIYFALFLIAVWAQVRAKAFHPFLYWAVIIATTTVGTTMADYTDRSLGVGYIGGSLILFALLMTVLAIWRFSTGSVSVAHIRAPKVETFYWVTILASNTLGTALGDYMADPATGLGLGYEGGAVVFAAALLVIALLYYRTKISHTLLFWAAFILTRPLGATLGDTLTKPIASGGLHLGRIDSSLAIAIFIIGCVLVLPQNAGRHPGEENRA